MLIKYDEVLFMYELHDKVIFSVFMFDNMVQIINEFPLENKKLFKYQN